MFAKAGLQVGDVVLALDKAPVKSVESFRKLLRHSLAGTQPLAFEIQRAGKALTISVPNKGGSAPKS
jgi:S1-C subfamily serine protease